MIDEQQFEQGRSELEAILNKEISATQEARKEEIKYWCSHPSKNEWKIEVSDDDLKKKEEWCKKVYGGLMYIRQDSTSIIGKGRNQIVFPVGKWLVAKATFCNPYIARFLDGFDFYEIGGCSFPDYPQTIKLLNENGFEVPPIKLYKLIWDKDKVAVSSDINANTLPDNLMTQYRKFPLIYAGEHFNYPNIYLTPDLRESGKYIVVNFDKEIAQKLVNGDELIAQFNVGLRKLIEFENNYNAPWTDGGKYIVLRTPGVSQRAVAYYNPKTMEEIKDARVLTVFSGGGWESKRRKPYFLYDYGLEEEDKTALGAMKKMFLLQVPIIKDQPGKLVIGDINHIRVHG